MTDTIHITGDYVVDAGDDLDFLNQTGFKIDATAGPASLDIEGLVLVHDETGSEIAGVEIKGRQAVSLTIGADGQFRVRSDHVHSGNASAVVDYASALSFDNAGRLDVYSHDSCFGVIAAATGADLDNEGRISVASRLGASALLAGDEAVVHNSGTVVVAGRSYQARAMTIGADGQIDNSGTIQVTGKIGGALAVEIGARSSLINQGVIDVAGTDSSIAVQLDDGASGLINSGKILAVSSHNDAAWGIYVGAADQDHSVLTIANTGLIRADVAIMIDTTGFTNRMIDIANDGRIFGGISLNDESDTVHNTGRIAGAVDLGQGDDVFDGGHGRVAGPLSGGTGVDVLTTDKGDQLVYGDSAREETRRDGGDLISSGRGEDSLHGGGGDDTLIGGAGGDELSGGSGEDHFTYLAIGDSAKGVADLILDLDNHDHIDLSAIDADATQAGDQAFQRVAVLDGHAGQLALTYDPDGDLTSVLGDIDGDGVADLEIRLAGDHTADAHFVL